MKHLFLICCALVGLAWGLSPESPDILEPTQRIGYFEGNAVSMSPVDVVLRDEFENLVIKTWKEDGSLDTKTEAKYAYIQGSKMHMKSVAMYMYEGTRVTHCGTGAEAILDMVTMDLIIKEGSIGSVE